MANLHPLPMNDVTRGPPSDGPRVAIPYSGGSVTIPRAWR